MTAIIIDITSRPPKVTAPPPPAPAECDVSVSPPATNCLHRAMDVDRTQRLVTCRTCGKSLDPVWCLLEVFDYYERRVDDRVKRIEAFEAKQLEREKRRDARRERSRAARLEQRDYELERAIHNEYQSKLLALRASRQRGRADRIDAELAAEDGAVRGLAK